MERRKLVKSGKTSFIVALPIEWVRKNRLTSGSEVIFSEKGTGELTINPEKEYVSSDDKRESVTITVDDKDIDDLKIELGIYYIRDVASINLEGKSVKQMSKKIQELVDQLIGFDIIEQGSRFIRIKNLFSLDNDMAPENILRKINLINRTSLNVLNNFFNKGIGADERFELQNYHSQNKRLANMGDKSILKIFNRPELASKLRTNNIQLMKDKKSLMTYIKISSNLRHLGLLFGMIEHKSAEAILLKKYFIMFKKHYEEVTASVVNKDTDRLINFIKQYPEIKSTKDKIVNEVSNHIIIQSTITLAMAASNLKDLAYETLI